MNSKLIITALTCLSASCGIANASLVKATSDAVAGLTDEELQTRFKGMKLTPGFNRGEEVVGLELKTADGGVYQFGGFGRYMGPVSGDLSNMLAYMTDSFKIYKPGMKLNVAKEIKVTDEDNLNLVSFRKFAVDNAFKWTVGETLPFDLPSGFETFKNSTSCAFDRFPYSKNSLVFSMMYYLESSQAQPVTLKHKTQSYNNQSFTFLPTTDKESGIKMDFVFKIEDFGYSSKADFIKDATDTTQVSLVTDFGSLTTSRFKIALYKVDEATYRVNLKLTTQENSASMYSDAIWKDQKISNFLVQVKSN